jgi:hypothetical protein
MAAICGVLGGGIVAADEVPDLEFLEYLGSWEGSEEDWLLFKESDTDAASVSDESSDPLPAGGASTEKDDED